jgi:hypothetical protein
LLALVGLPLPDKGASLPEFLPQKDEVDPPIPELTDDELAELPALLAAPPLGPDPAGPPLFEPPPGLWGGRPVSAPAAARADEAIDCLV